MQRTQETEMQNNDCLSACGSKSETRMKAVLVGQLEIKMAARVSSVACRAKHVQQKLAVNIFPLLFIFHVKIHSFVL